ncbi:hypothetical protein BX600DRAFT_456448 [Xylariales sp. PMI_506]|nr:hypothetical protein BX600DRAFT_456448 [Xylariales sp. PMI_506]
MPVFQIIPFFRVLHRISVATLPAYYSTMLFHLSLEPQFSLLPLALICLVKFFLAISFHTGTSVSPCIAIWCSMRHHFLNLQSYLAPFNTLSSSSCLSSLTASANLLIDLG